MNLIRLTGTHKETRPTYTRMQQKLNRIYTLRYTPLTEGTSPCRNNSPTKEGGWGTQSRAEMKVGEARVEPPAEGPGHRPKVESREGGALAGETKPDGVETQVEAGDCS